MQSKSLLIAVAAFAVTTSGVFAYSGNTVLDRANLSQEQKTAITRARELKESGNLIAARDSLVEAGVDENVLRKLHTARHEVENEMRAALSANDYAAFMVAIAETPLAVSITSEADFQQFRSAHELKDVGDFVAAQQILEELGIDPKQHHKYHGKKHVLSELSVEQTEAFFVAKQSNDKATMQAILDEAGVYRPVRDQ